MLRVLRDYEISQRRACVLIGVDPKTVRRDRPPDHRAIRDAMKDVAGKRRRFGYRRIGVMLERQGMIMNHKKLYRLYREEGLSVRRRRGRKRARGSRTPMPVPLAPGTRWSMDFVSDTFGASRKFRILAINDDCCRENLCLVGDTSISGARVARELGGAGLARARAGPGVHFAGRASQNLFVAGEMMSGNVLGKGYTAGVGMSIGTAFGRLAGVHAAQVAIKSGEIHAAT